MTARRDQCLDRSRCSPLIRNTVDQTIRVPSAGKSIRRLLGVPEHTAPYAKDERTVTLLHHIWNPIRDLAGSDTVSLPNGRTMDAFRSRELHSGAVHPDGDAAR